MLCMWDYTVTVTLSQISPAFWKIPREFPEKFGNLVRISGVWIENSSVFNEHSSGLNIPVVELKILLNFQSTEILWYSIHSVSH